MFSTITKKAANVLADNRQLVDYRNYVTSDAHKNRMKHLPKRLQIPRDKWFNHRNWQGRIHMPNYHVHFREDMQEAVKAVVRSFQARSLADRRRNVAYALQTLRGVLRSLSGHVSIEERRVFPAMVRANPDVDLKFLWEDHKELHETADEVVEIMQQYVKALTAAKESNNDTDSTQKSTSFKLSALDASDLRPLLEAAAVPHKHCVEVEKLRALLAKHESEVMKEAKAALRLAGVSTQECLGKGDIARLYLREVCQRHGAGGARVLKALLLFDTVLLTHLGEEEETVVPMELQERPLH